jgi:hypothetical protein
MSQNSTIPKDYYLLQSTNGFQWIKNMEASFHLSGTIRWANGTNPKPHSTLERSDLTQVQKQEIVDFS